MRTWALYARFLRRYLISKAQVKPCIFSVSCETRLLSGRVIWAGRNPRHDRLYWLHAGEAMGRRGIGPVPREAGCCSETGPTGGTCSEATVTGDHCATSTGLFARRRTGFVLGGSTPGVGRFRRASSASDGGSRG